MPASGLLLYGNYARRILSYRGYRKDKMFIMANSLDYKLNIEIRKKLKKQYISRIFWKHLSYSCFYW